MLKTLKNFAIAYIFHVEPLNHVAFVNLLNFMNTQCPIHNVNLWLINKQTQHIYGIYVMHVHFTIDITYKMFKHAHPYTYNA